MIWQKLITYLHVRGGTLCMVRHRVAYAVLCVVEQQLYKIIQEL